MPTKSPDATIVEVNHPYLTVAHLSDVSAGELIVLPDESLGLVMSFSQDVAQVISLGTQPALPGQPVARLYQHLQFPIYPELAGRVYSPVGTILMGSTSTKNTMTQPLDADPVPLGHRYRIKETLTTGVSLVDQLLPLGRGQRQLITGDRKTGKTTFALNVAITQAKLGHVVVYAMIGKKSSDIFRVQQVFRDANVSDKIVIIASTANDSPSLIHITPSAAICVAEYFRDQGCHVLVVLDDLSTHAKFYRQLALLAKQFPGRDSYPGDVFSVHAHLLERAGCFKLATLKPTATTDTTCAAFCKTEGESASITCLPLAETVDGDLTDYIVSNLISITDGHLLFDDQLFQQGQRPAIHTSLSVTRVGKQTLSPLGRDINQRMNNFIAEYQRTQELSHFGTELREESQQILKRGQVMMDFFSLNVLLPLPIQHILLGTIWLDWWETANESTLAPEIENLLQRYNDNPDDRTWLEGLIANSQQFTDLVDQLTVNKDRLIRLCQP